MKFIALAFIGVALATYSAPTLPVPLKVNNEYRYRFEGSLESGLPVNTETSNTRINTNVVFQVVDDRTVLFRLEDIKLASAHTKAGKILPIEALENRILAEEHQNSLETPVKFHYKHGLVSEIQFAPEEPEWSANIKRAVISMIQININKVGREMEENSLLTETVNDFFTANEKTVEGDCQVAYTTVGDKEDNTIVTKSINFQKCNKRPEIRYNFRYFSDCEKCSSNSDIIAQTLYTYKIEKDQLQEVELVSTYIMNVEQSSLKTDVRSLLTLLEVTEISETMEIMEGPKEDLVYSTKWEEQVERFFKNGDEKDNMIFESYSGKIELAEKILVRESEVDQNNAETAHILARLVRALRMSSVHDLKKLHQTVFSKVTKKQQSLIEHALAIAGTKNTIEHLLHHIQSGDISGRQAIPLFKEMQDTTYPSAAIADMLIEFAQHDLVLEEPTLRQSVWLCIGSVVRGIVAPTNEKHLVDENTLGNKEKYLRVIRNELEHTKSTYEKVLFVKVLANANIDISIVTLEKIITDRKEDTVVRIEAIDALRLIGEQMPRKVQRILMPIYISNSEKPEIRMSALIYILKTGPEQPLLTQIVYNMNRKVNQQVSAFTFKALTSISKSSNPCYKVVSTRIAPLLSESQYKPEAKIMSSFSSHSFFDESLSGLTVNLATMFGKESDLPKELIASIDSVSNHKWIRGFMQMGMSQQNIDQLLNKIINRINKVESKITRGNRLSQPVNFIKELARKMKIQTRSTEREDPYAQIYLRYKQMDYAIIPMDEKIMDSLIEKYLQNGVLSLKDLLDVSRDFDYHHASFLQEDVIKIPTSLGLPLSFTSKTPSVLSAKGTISSKFSAKGYSVRLTTNPHFVITKIYEARTWIPLLEQGVKHIDTKKINLPIDYELDLNTHRELEIQMKQRVTRNEYQIFHSASRPVAYFRFPKHNNINAYVEADEKTIRQVNWEKNVVEDNTVLEGYNHKISLNSWKVKSMHLGESEFELLVQPTQINNLLFNIKTYEPKKEIIDIRAEDIADEDMAVEDYETERRVGNKRREEMQEYSRKVTVTSRRVVLTVGTEEDRIVTDFRWMVAENSKFLRYMLDTTFPTAYSAFNVKSKLDILLPVQQNGISIEKSNEYNQREIQVIIESAWGSKYQNNFNSKVHLQFGKTQGNLIKTTELRGLDNVENLVDTVRLNQVKSAIEYNIPSKESQLLFDRLSSFIRSQTIWVASIQQNTGTVGRRIYLVATVGPQSKSVDIKLRTPQEIITLTGIPVPYMELLSYSRSPISQMRRSVYKKASCEIRKTKINTFDEVIYAAPLTTCWSVIAKDCSEEPKFVVMVKKANKKATEKKVKIMSLEDVYELELVKEEVVVRVNNKVVRGSSEEYGIERLSSDVVLVELKDVTVRFDGEIIKVELSNTHMNTQCGLCGHFNGEKDYELRTASGEETDDIERVHRSFIVKHEECEMDEETLSEKKNYRMYGEEEYEYDYEMEKKPLNKNHKTWESTNTHDENEQTEKTAPQKETHIIEFAHRICFSLEPVPKCPSNKVNFRGAEKKVKFTCLPRHENEARRLKAESLRAPLHIQHMPVSFVENILVPQACEVY